MGCWTQYAPKLLHILVSVNNILVSVNNILLVVYNILPSFC